MQCQLTSFYVHQFNVDLQVSSNDTKKKQKKKKNKNKKSKSQTDNEDAQAQPNSSIQSNDNPSNNTFVGDQEYQSCLHQNNDEPNETVDGAIGGPIEPVLQYFDSIEQENRNLKVSQSFYEAIKQENEILRQKLKENEKSLKENAELKQKLKESESRICKICMEEEVQITFLPCGHLMSCVNCAPALKNCPICRRPIKGSVRTYQ